ncbi:melibiose:sodium transporter MelB [Nanchangia anserum]|uniref:Melibiose:sodium transporter MelB n=1 Tax=Nanchangia anserum TaxID=2692125 RepID=A0A8I0GG44_9ACTO|nr:melibiose:sodium transporter MelB [Nanchangia anserum]MBD3689404.1 melibiose:sodium transporter MelB [Nanchangia anserum]QOX81611.1 melibiose:sodium transporter MelB [Nanchangia anserum]
MASHRLSWTSKLCFGMGAFGKDLVYAIVGTYLMKYLTDIRMVDPAFVGVLFMAARIWDAFNDPIMGVIVDNTRSRWGKFRPWILIGTIVNAVVLVLLFLDVDLSPGAYAAWVAAMYILWGMTYTIMDIPYWSLVPAVTDDEQERSQMSAIPRFFASTAWLAVGSGGLFIVKYLGDGNSILGYSRFAIGIACIFIITSILTVWKVRERVVSTAGTGQKTSLRHMVKVLTKNDQVIVVLGIALFFNMGYQLSTGFALYYFEYVCGVKESLFATYTAVAGFAQMGAMVAFPILSRIITKRQLFALASLLPTIGFVVLFTVGLIDPRSIVLVGVSSAIINVGIGFMLVAITVILAEAVDYGEFKLGTRNESVVFSTQTFVVKFAGAFSGLISGVGLKLIGFVPNEVQSATAITGMRVIMIVVPAILSLLCLVVYVKGYRLNETYYRQVIASLRGESPAEAAREQEA